jgi:hypothetical protein
MLVPRKPAHLTTIYQKKFHPWPADQYMVELTPLFYTKCPDGPILFFRLIGKSSFSKSVVLTLIPDF